MHDVPRGKVLGGSSSINVMAHIRGHHTDYDAWAYAGNPGWSYRDVLPYFKRTEDCPGRDPAHRGRGGPLRPAPVREPNPTSQVFLDAAAEVGHRASDDLNGADQEGAGWYDLLITDGRRHSVAAAYLAPAAERPNLTVLTDAQARRLRFDGSRCTGVEYVRDGALQGASAEAEVVVCAGAIDSPRLLLLSGLGPADDLRELGLPVVADLPGVGRNYSDHLMLGVVYEASRPIPPATAGYAEALAVWRSDPGRVVPDFQFVLIHIPLPSPLTAPPNSYTVTICLMHPVSVGSIRLASADPDTAPLIDPNHLGDEADLDALLVGIDHARELGESSAFAPWRAREALPGEGVRDEAALRDFARNAVVSYFHPVGTCRMGVDRLAVVDPQLRVRGVDGLRVADASVMPSIVTANTNAAAMMIGEKAADLVRG